MKIRPIILAALLLIGVSGCGTAPVASQAPKTPRHHVLRDGAFSVTVPASWALGQRVTLSRVEATGTNNGLLIPQMSKNSAHLVNTPYNQSPFFTETATVGAHSATVQVWDLTPHGNYYHLDITVPASEQRALTRAIQSIHAPKPATVTEDVALLYKNSLVTSPLWLASSSAPPAYHWVLLGGQPATAQEPFYLFPTKDGGHHWSLINYSFRPHHIFPTVDGTPGLLFWNAHEGIIAESPAVLPDLLIYRTTDGGRNWTETKIAMPSKPNGATAPQTAWYASGRLTITVSLANGHTTHLTSTNGGMTWTMDNTP